MTTLLVVDCVLMRVSVGREAMLRPKDLLRCDLHEVVVTSNVTLVHLGDVAITTTHRRNRTVVR